MAFKIYTKTGDLGKTSLIGGTKVSKSHLRIESYGTVDELNSYIGLVNDLTTDEVSRTTLKEIHMKIPDLLEGDVLFLEQEIDRMNAILPEMKSFVLPGGHIAVSTTHVA